MKVAVIGAGAVGTMFGALIKHHSPEVDVVLLCRGAHGEAMQRTGRVVLHGRWGARIVPAHATEQPADIAGARVALFTVKSGDTESAAMATAPHLDDRAVVVSIQNGINQDVLAGYFPYQRLVAGMTTSNMAIATPGVVSLPREGLTIIGPAAASTSRDAVDEALRVLGRSGLAVRTHKNIRGAQYNKLLLNTVGYASVLSDSNFITECVLCPDWRQAIAIPLLEEGLQVLTRSKITVARTGSGSDVLRFRRLLHLLKRPVIQAGARFVVQRLIRPNRIVYSVYQDLIRGKTTEIDAVNGHIVRFALRGGGSAAYNAQVVAMVRELESRKPAIFFSKDEVLSRFCELRRRNGAEACGVGR